MKSFRFVAFEMFLVLALLTLAYGMNPGNRRTVHPLSLSPQAGQTTLSSDNDEPIPRRSGTSSQTVNVGNNAGSGGNIDEQDNANSHGVRNPIDFVNSDASLQQSTRPISDQSGHTNPRIPYPQGDPPYRMNLPLELAQYINTLEERDPENDAISSSNTANPVTRDLSRRHRPSNGPIPPQMREFVQPLNPNRYDAIHPSNVRPSHSSVIVIPDHWDSVTGQEINPMNPRLHLVPTIAQVMDRYHDPDERFSPGGDRTGNTPIAEVVSPGRSFQNEATFDREGNLVATTLPNVPPGIGLSHLTEGADSDEELARFVESRLRGAFEFEPADLRAEVTFIAQYIRRITGFRSFRPELLPYVIAVMCSRIVSALPDPRVNEVELANLYLHYHSHETEMAEARRIIQDAVDAGVYNFQTIAQEFAIFLDRNEITRNRNDENTINFCRSHGQCLSNPNMSFIFPIPISVLVLLVGMGMIGSAQVPLHFACIFTGLSYIAQVMCMRSCYHVMDFEEE